jgi:hypothetical protein
VQRHSFAVFAWWRILLGSVGLIAIYFASQLKDQPMPRSAGRL